MTMRVSFTLNGRPADVECEPTETLQAVLRWKLELPSVRSTCGIGVCGACTVLVDGRATSSCLMMAPLASGCSITTAEGLDEDDPVVEAFVEEHAFQCSYCTPGFVMATRGLVAVHPTPTDEQIERHLSGNLCRCGSYRAVVDAVKRASRVSRSTP